MKYRALPRVVAIHMALIEEHDALLKRLAAINEVLGPEDIHSVRKKTTRPLGPKAARSILPTETPLIQMVLDFTMNVPKPVVEVLAHLRAKKYKFETDDPLNELLAALENSFSIKDYGGKVGPTFGNPK